MQKIECPKCGEVFQIDEAGYNQISRQIRDKEFEKELTRREKELKSAQEKEIELLRLKNEKERAKEITEKESEILSKEKTIAELQAKVNANENELKLAIANAVEEKNKMLSQRDNNIAILKGELKSKETENQLKEKSLKEQYEIELRNKDEEIAFYKDYKAKQSTKMIGESLEQHCVTEFNRMRMAAFPNAYFEKDNDAKSGSKGDFIFRECDEQGCEFISIMFEMKNEEDTTASKHKNSDFLKELDKDRIEKNCEYAVLVSLLERDSELYNDGIVDVSYKYPKMYVIRPQFFIPIISLLRNAAQNSLSYRKELQAVRNQQIDVVHFEENMNDFKRGFSRNFQLASKKFENAINEIDKSIEHLQKMKSELLSSENNLRLANKKSEELSIKMLTKNAPSIKAMFDESKRDGE